MNISQLLTMFWSTVSQFCSFSSWNSKLLFYGFKERRTKHNMSIISICFCDIWMDCLDVISMYRASSIVLVIVLDIIELIWVWLFNHQAIVRGKLWKVRLVPRPTFYFILKFRNQWVITAISIILKYVCWSKLPCSLPLTSAKNILILKRHSWS